MAVKINTNTLKNKKCSFDFDTTLDRTVVQELATELMARGVDVWVCTARFTDEEVETKGWGKDWNYDLWAVIDKLGIPREKVLFTGMQDKFKYLDEDFIWHLDDDGLELEILEENSKVVGINSWDNNEWRERCLELLNGE